MAKKKEDVINLDNEILQLRKEMSKKFGDSVIRIHTETVRHPTIPTGILSFDIALGGGLPEGRMIELAGESGSGKSTIALCAIANAQKQFPDKICFYIDTENALSLTWAEKLGVDLKRFDHVIPDTGENAIYIMEAYLKMGKVSIGVLDSVPALMPTKELAGEIGEANVGRQAALVAQTMRRMTSVLVNHPRSSLIFINQKRAKLEGGPRSMGSGEQSKNTGGRSLPFFMTTRVEVKRIGTLSDDTNKEESKKDGVYNSPEYGQRVLTRIIKHKVNDGHGQIATFWIDNRIGIDNPLFLLEWAVKTDRIKKGGSWYSFADGKKVQGEDKAKDYVKQNYDTFLKDFKENGSTSYDETQNSEASLDE